MSLASFLRETEGAEPRRLGETGKPLSLVILSDGPQIVCRRLACPSISNDLKRDLLSLIEAIHPGTFDGADVHEDILAAIIRLDEAEAFLTIEPLYRSLRHMTVLSMRVWIAAR